MSTEIFALTSVTAKKKKIRQYKETEKNVLFFCGIFKCVLTDNEMSEDIPEGKDWYRYIDNIETKYMDKYDWVYGYIIYIWIWIYELDRNSSVKNPWCVIGLEKSEKHQETFFSMGYHYA